jgi:hypothetical protein
MYHVTVEGWAIMECTTLENAFTRVYATMQTTADAKWEWEPSPTSTAVGIPNVATLNNLDIDGRWVNKARGKPFIKSVKITEIAASASSG